MMVLFFGPELGPNRASDPSRTIDSEKCVTSQLLAPFPGKLCVQRWQHAFSSDIAAIVLATGRIDRHDARRFGWILTLLKTW
jgi:hypothetical protein